jgi:hypothetical protein
MLIPGSKDPQQTRDHVVTAIHALITGLVR